MFAVIVGSELRHALFYTLRIEGMLVVYSLIVAAIFGLTPILEKYILKSITVETVMILSGLFYGIFMVIYVFCCHGPHFVKDLGIMMERPALWVLVPTSAFLILIIANFLYLSVLRDHKTYLATAITASYPFFTVLAGFLLFQEMITVTHFIGILLIASGIFALSAN